MELDIKNLLKEIKHNDLISEKQKKLCRALTYIDNFHIFVFAVSGCILRSPFTSLVGVLVGITSSE